MADNSDGIMSIYDGRKKWSGWETYSWKKLYGKSLRKKESLHKIYVEAEKYVLVLISESFKGFYFGDKDISLAENDLVRIEKQLVKSLSPIAYKVASRYLGKSLSLGADSRQLNWKVPCTLNQFTLLKDLPVISDDSYLSGGDLKVLTGVFINHLTSISHLTELSQAGQIIWSAVLFGGYEGTQKDFFLMLEHNLESGCHGTCLVSIDANNLARSRWFADPLTVVLIRKFLKGKRNFLRTLNSDKSGGRKAFRSFRKELLNSSGISKAPIYLELCKISKHSQIEYLPAFLSHDNGANSLSTPLSNHAWNRLQNKTSPQLETTKRLKNLPPLDEHGVMNVQMDYKIEKNSYFQGVNLFSGKKLQALTKSEIKNIIDGIIVSNGITPNKSIALMLISWGEHLINEKKVAIKTGHDYLTSFGSKLLRILALRSSFPVDEDDWIEVYVEMFELVRTKQITAVSNHIIDFHQFAADQGWVCAIDNNSIRRYGPNGKVVDANLITFHEFDALVNELKKGVFDRRTRMQILIASLGFYCGMRVSEILGLRICDLVEARLSTLNITANQFRNSKSATSDRISPLYVLLPNSVLADLLKFKQERLIESKLSSENKANHFELLFCKADQPIKMLSNDYIIKPMMNILKDIANDDNIRFHHLRHSFANWLLVRLLANNYPKIIDPNIHVFNHNEFSKDKILKLNNELLYDGFKVRPILYQVANLLGHASPKTTLSSYIHLDDWIRKQILHQYTEPVLNKEQLSGLLRVSQSTLYNWRSELDLRDDSIPLCSSYLQKVK